MTFPLESAASGPPCVLPVDSFFIPASVLDMRQWAIQYCAERSVFATQMEGRAEGLRLQIPDPGYGQGGVVVGYLFHPARLVAFG
ncbi:hypothetical protein JCM14722_16810 [Pseudodesulfovibrio portus]|uniref:GNAT family N-acetyltransferase n=1 Tax=Pseudodesulfovibrio portus TaxID=231439 RepID=A0ABM8ARQ9_9BACT|nr:hypothetical protein JCM14722_16810 [Pseudodesulfovibrio portus]